MTYKYGQCAEYGAINKEQFSVITTLDSAYGAFNRLFELQHCSEGFHVAGSAAQYQAEKWRVVYQYDNARHGKSFATEAEAREYFERYTKPIEEVTTC